MGIVPQNVSLGIWGILGFFLEFFGRFVYVETGRRYRYLGPPMPAQGGCQGVKNLDGKGPAVWAGGPAARMTIPHRNFV